MGDLVAKADGDLLAGCRSIFDRVVQQTCCNGRRVHLHLNQNLGHLQRMDDVRFARGPHLPFMVADAELPGLANQSEVFTGAIGVDLTQQRFKALIKSSSLLEIRLARRCNTLFLSHLGRSRAGRTFRNQLSTRRHASL